MFRRFPEAEVTGIDLSRDMLEKAREKFAGRRFQGIEADYFEYPFYCFSARKTTVPQF